MKSKDKPYVLLVAELIYLKVCEIKKKILILQILMRLKHLLALKLIKKLVVENFMTN